jgi:hypothetical protein
LRIGDETDRNAVFRARSSTTSSIVIAGIRCIITYLLIPILTPVVGLVGVVGPWLSIALSLAAVVMGVVAVRRFFIADHRHRWAYAAFIGLVICALLVGIAMDVRSTSGHLASII